MTRRHGLPVSGELLAGIKHPAEREIRRPEREEKEREARNEGVSAGTE